MRAGEGLPVDELEAGLGAGRGGCDSGPGGGGGVLWLDLWWGGCSRYTAAMAACVEAYTKGGLF